MNVQIGLHAGRRAPRADSESRRVVCTRGLCIFYGIWIVPGPETHTRWRVGARGGESSIRCAVCVCISPMGICDAYVYLHTSVMCVCVRRNERCLHSSAWHRARDVYMLWSEGSTYTCITIRSTSTAEKHGKTWTT